MNNTKSRVEPPSPKTLTQILLSNLAARAGTVTVRTITKNRFALYWDDPADNGKQSSVVGNNLNFLIYQAVAQLAISKFEHDAISQM